MNNLLKIINKIQTVKCKTGLKLAENEAEKLASNKPEYSEIILRSLNGKKKRLEEAK